VEYDRKVFASNQLKNNHIRTKKSHPVQDREQLYADNMGLRSKIKEVNEANIKLKTQLLITEKEKINLCLISD
jgi:hypothetical protein